MRFWGVGEWTVLALVLVAIAGTVYAVQQDIREADVSRRCNTQCMEHGHIFSRINTAGECVCGDEVAR